jgi:hypothetical protein
MSYATNFSGEIEIVPPLTYGEIKDSPHYLPNWQRDRRPGDLVFRTEIEDIETDEGVLQTVRAVAIVGAEGSRGGTAEAELAGIVSAFMHVRGGGVRDWVGRLDASGEDPGDLWRLKVVDGYARKFEPEFVWPKESN